MRFLDSWVWLEFLFDGEAADDAEAAIQRANTPEVGGLVAPTVVAEVSYRLRVVDGAEPAEEAVRAIRDYEHVESLPLVDEVADYAAELRHDYYESGERETLLRGRDTPRNRGRPRRLRGSLHRRPRLRGGRRDRDGSVVAGRN